MASRRGALAGDATGHALTGLQSAALAADEAGREAEALALLRPWFDTIDWLHGLADGAVARLAQTPLHLFGLTALSSGPLQQLLLFAGARVSVSLGMFADAASYPQPPTPASYAFAGHRSLFRLLSADTLAGRIGWLDRRDGRCRERAVVLHPGGTLDLDEARRALWIAPPPRQALFLRARIRRLPAPLVASYRVGGDRPRSVANGDDGLARSLAMTALLRALGRHPPVTALRALLPRAHGRMRWTLMREMLAADTAAAWPDLAAMAATEQDPAVRAAARALIDRLTPAAA